MFLGRAFEQRGPALQQVFSYYRNYAVCDCGADTQLALFWGTGQTSALKRHFF